MSNRLKVVDRHDRIIRRSHDTSHDHDKLDFTSTIESSQSNNGLQSNTDGDILKLNLIDPTAFVFVRCTVCPTIMEDRPES